MSVSKSVENKVKVKRIKWREVIFNLHRKDISEAFDLFRSKHPDMSINRCAYNVLKTYYSTAIMRGWKDLFEKHGQSYEDTISLKLVHVKWC